MKRRVGFARFSSGNTVSARRFGLPHHVVSRRRCWVVKCCEDAVTRSEHDGEVKTK